MADFILLRQASRRCMGLSAFWLLHHAIIYCDPIGFGFVFLPLSFPLCLFLSLSIFAVLRHYASDIDLEFVSARRTFNFSSSRMFVNQLSVAGADVVFVRSTLHMRVHR